MTTAYQVDYLLSMTRIPRRFYAMIMGLDGRDAIYKNPGVSIQSYVIARAINNEVIMIPPELLDDVKECEAFSTSKEVLAKINEAMINVCTQLINYVSALQPEQRTELFHDISKAHELAKMIKTSFDAFMSTQDPIAMHVDISSMSGITYKQAVFDIQDAIENLSHKLEQLSTTPPSVA